MRGLIISICLLLVVGVCMTVNRYYMANVQSELDKFSHSLSDIPDKENEKLIQDTQRYWDSVKTFLSLSVNFKLLDDFSNALDSLLVANNIGSAEEFAIYKKICENSIETIFRLEKFTLENIL